VATPSGYPAVYHRPYIALRESIPGLFERANIFFEDRFGINFLSIGALLSLKR
jgi:hypothetical protein